MPELNQNIERGVGDPPLTNQELTDAMGYPAKTVYPRYMPGSGNVPFQKVEALRSLANMKQKGSEYFDAVEHRTEATRRLEAINNVTPEVSQAAKSALDSTIRSLEIKSRMNNVRANFWGFVGKTFGRDPLVRARKAGERQIHGVGVSFREGGAKERAMTKKDQMRHEREQQKGNLEVMNNPIPEEFNRRERLFNWANEKARNAMAKHSQLIASIETLREQMPRVYQSVEDSLESGVVVAQEQQAFAQEGYEEKSKDLSSAVSDAYETNYSGYSNSSGSVVETYADHAQSPVEV